MYHVLRKYCESEEEYPAEEKYLYILLIAPGYTNKLNEPLKGSTWLHKTMHVISQNIDELNYDFDAHDFGTFSPDLQIIQTQNITSNIIEQKNKHGPMCLTDKGSKIAKKLWDNISENERKIISETKSFLNEMNRKELIAFSYSTFPETTHKPQINDEFNNTRFNSALSLFKRQKISLNKASSIAGMSEKEFSQELMKRKIHSHSISKSDFDSSLRYVKSLT